MYSKSKISAGNTLWIDVDGVIADTVNVIWEEMRHVSGLNLPEPTQWNFHEEWGMTQEDVWSSWCYSKSRIYPRSAEWVLDMRRKSHDVKLLTARSTPADPLIQLGSSTPDEVQFVTEKWMDRHNMGTIPISYYHEKVDIILPGDYIVDDNPDTIRACLARGINGYLVSRSYNRNYSHNIPEKHILAGWPI